MGNSDRRKFVDTLLKMDTTTWLSVALAVITFATPALTSEPRVVCYYTNWSVYRPGTAKFNPQNINPYLCTHLIYAFGGFTKDNTLKPFDKYQDIEKGGYAKFTGLKTYNKNLKTMLAIGGWNEGSTRFSPMVASKERRKEFVRNAIKFLRQNRFDGLDLDWEYPAFRDGGKPKDRENYARLVRELREEFNREAEKTGRPRLLLTMAVPAGIEYIQKGFDVKTLNRYLDWMNLLTYDYHSAFEPAVNHHAPLYPLEEPNEYSVDSELNIDYTIKFYLENGADRDKLVLGIPTYGRSYTLFNADAVDIGSPADGPGEQGDATREKGYLAYYEICESLKPKSRKRSASDEESEEVSEEEEEEDLPWSVMHPNPSAMGPVAYRGNQWVGYDDTEIVKKKAEYVAENGLGGIMFWSIDNDDFRGTCHGKPYPLIEAAKEAYIVKLGSTDNAIVTDKPRSVTTSRSSSRRRNRPRVTTTTTTTEKPSTVAKASKRKSSSSVTSTTPSWNITPEPPTTPDPGSDFKCKDEGFFQHPRDCKKYFWCLDSGPSNLGIVAHQFTCPSGLFFNKAADSCDFARNVLCKLPSATTKPATTKATTSTTSTTTTTRRPAKLSTKSSSQFRTTSTTTPEPESEEEYEYEEVEDAADIDAEDPRVIKELIDLIKKVGGVEQLEKHLHLAETSMSTDVAVSTTPSSFNKRLYQKVLERTRGKTKLTGNSLADALTQNSRGGPQNAGLEPSSDKDKLLRRDRPQYTTINRARPSTSTKEPQEEESVEDEVEEAPQQLSRARAVESQAKVATTAKPLQYVNIRRARPTVATSDTADDTASRNALFERSETYVTVSDSPNSLDIAIPARDNIPEYVTIRRQRPTTEEATTVQYQNTEPEEESQETALEREISSPASQPQYTSIIRTRSTTTPTPEEITPEPTTVLAVQISSLLNSPISSEESETTVEADTTTASTTSRPTTTTTTTTTTPAPQTPPPRRQLIRRRSTTTTSTTTSAPASSTQVSSRNYTFVRRRRPLSQPNEISDSDDTELSRTIRSTTPDSREVDGKARETGFTRRFKSRFQTEDSVSDQVPDAASPVSRGQYRAQLTRDEVLSLTPVDVDEEIPQFVPKPSFTQRTERRFRGRTSTTVAEPGRAEDSEVSAAEVRRPNIVPRGRGRFTPSSTTVALEQSVATESTPSQRRPTFGRFTPRPFSRTTSASTTVEDDDEKDDAPVVTQRIPPRLPFGRFRPSSTTAATSAPPVLARRLPFPSRLTTTQQTLTSEQDEDEPEENNDEISLSESAIEEKEHEENLDEGEDEEPQKRRVIIKKFRVPSSSPAENTSPTEAVPITDDNGKRKFRVIRRRPTSTTESLETSSVSTEAPSSTPTRIRKIIRKKLRPAEDEPAIIAKSIGSLNSALKDTTTEVVVNYGEKSRPTPSTTTEAPTTAATLQKSEPITESEETKEEAEQDIEKEQKKGDDSKSEDQKETDISDTKEEEENQTVEKTNSEDSESDSKPEVAVEAVQKAIDFSENKDESTSDEPTTVETAPNESAATESEEPQTETTTPSTTQQTSPSTRNRLPYRPPKRKLFTSTTEATPSSSRTYSRRYNPGAYTSPATVDRASESNIRQAVTRRPLFSSRTFTRRPFTTARTTPKVEEEEEEYSDEEILDEEPENEQVFVPNSQLFTRRPNLDNEDGEEENYNSEEEEDETSEEEQSVNRFPSSRKPVFKPRVVNSNTFRTTTSTTEIPKRLSSQNRTSIYYNKFGANKSVNDTKTRVQNVPLGYSSPSAAKPKPATNQKKEIVADKDSEEVITTTTASTDETETTTEDDDYLSMTEPGTTVTDNTDASEDSSSTNSIESETATADIEIDDSTDDYLEYTEGTTNYPTTQYSTTNTQTETESETTSDDRITTVITERSVEETTTMTTTTETVPETTTSTTQAPIIKTQYNKLFSVSRVVEVNSKLDKHRLNKNNETTLIEEGKIMVEKKPKVDEIGEVSRFSLIKIYEDEIPIYLTKLGHVYPVENPPDNLIRIDEARNARALVNFADAPRENLIASESMNEAYRHIVNSVTSQPKDNTASKTQVEHIQNDGFLSYINDDKRADKSEEEQSYPSWNFVPAAYENEKNKAAKSFEIITPRSMLTEPSTLPLEALFKTENPVMARKVGGDGDKQPFVVYSASVPTQKEDANIVKLEVLKPETGRSITTFAKGQEFHGPPVVAETTVKYPIHISVLPQTSETTTSTTTTTTPEPTSINTSPIMQLLTTAAPTTVTTEQQTTVVTTTEASTTETIPEETTTVKSLFDAKRKFAFPRRPIIKPANITRTAPRTAKKNNGTVSSNSFQKLNKTSNFSPNKNRYSANRAQNVPVDIRKKGNSPKVSPKTFTTEAPRSTTERKLYFKPIRPNLRPSFVPRRNTTPSPQVTGDT